MQVKQATPPKYPLEYPVHTTAAAAAICRFFSYASCERHAFAPCPPVHCHARGTLRCPLFITAETASRGPVRPLLRRAIQRRCRTDTEPCSC